MASRKWLAELIQSQYIPFIQSVKNTAAGHKKLEKFTEELRQSWAERNLTSLKQQQGCMDQIRRAIKDKLGEDHFSLDFIAFSTEEYTALNDDKQRSVAERNENVKYIHDPDRIVAQAVRLLERPDWADVAAGLAVLTGRRVTELLATARFEPKTKWSVTFTGALKRSKETQTLSFEIPTLTTADKVCAALTKIRKQLPDAQSMSADEINQKFSQRVAVACDRHFEDLVPSRAGGNLYTHLFRAVYATIATFWYCPANVDTVEFRAAIQGHYQILDEKSPTLKRSLAASRHYADFDIADSVIAQHHGKRKGIKLGHGGIEPIAAFQPEASVEPLEHPKRTRRKRSTLSYYAQDHDRWISILQSIAPDAKNQSERTAKLLEWIEAQFQQTPVEPASSQPQEPSPVVEIEPASLENQPIEDTPPKLDPTVQLLVEQMAQVMQSVAKLTDAISAGQLERTSPQRQRSTPSSTQTLHSTQSSTASTENPQPARPRGPRGASGEIVDRAIDAMMAYNDMPERLHQDKWAISINILKEFVSSQPAIQRGLEQREAEIRAHHEQHQIDPKKHNFFHRGKHKITDFIQIETEPQNQESDAIPN